LFVAITSLGWLLVNDQFQYQYVWSHGASEIDLRYKIASIWTAQEGSFLLWACTSALFALLSLNGTGPFQRWFTVAYSAFLASLAGILAYESPFKIIPDVIQKGQVFVPPSGSGMTPSLQNYWVVIHPPTIFLGFGSLTIAFAYAVAALIAREPHDWVARLRPWVLVSTSILGLGLCMGGLWAYETQGWGGFWAWDPVENVSFVPWLFNVVLLHGLLVQGIRKKWAATNLFLAGVPFIAFVYGTFLTRSGLLDKVSVHSFASMDKSALNILRTFLIVVCLGFVGLWIARSRKIDPQAPSENVFDRESIYRSAMMLLAMLSTVIAVGMSWPVITALRGGEGARVEEWLYHQVVVWFFLPLMVLMAIAPFVRWRNETPATLATKMNPLLGITIGVTGVALMAIRFSSWGTGSNDLINGPFGAKLPAVPLLALLLMVCVFVLVANIARLRELKNASAISKGGFIAHIGVAVILGGLILSRGLERKDQQFVQAGSPTKILDYTVTFKNMTKTDLADRDNKALFDVVGENDAFIARPGIYYYQQASESGMETKPQVWPHVERSLTHDVYFSLHAPILDVWEKALVLKKGQTKVQDGVSVTYVEPTMQGQPGQPGTRFGAKIVVRTLDESKHEQTYNVSPYMELQEGGVQPSLTPVGDDFFAVIESMNAADRSVSFKLMFQRPLYPVEIFIKPLTSLVWFGTGIIFIGGLMSAMARRSRRVEESEIEPTTIDSAATQKAFPAQA
jgi:cytochrome c-type biogenesis protein CcmF